MLSGLPLIHVPYPVNIVTSGTVALSMDAAGEKICQVFVAPKTGNISELKVRVGYVQTANSLKVSIQGLNSSGNPDGSILASGNAYATIATPVQDTTYTLTLNSAAPVTRGSRYCMVFEFSSWTNGNNQIGGSGQGSYSHIDYGIYSPYYFTSWNKGLYQLFFGIKYDDGSVLPGPGILPGLGLSTAFHSGSTPDEIGNLMVMPVACRAMGIWAFVDLDYETNFKYYGPSGDESITMSAAHRQLTNNFLAHNYFQKPKDLQKGDVLRITLQPTGSSGTITLYGIDSIPTGYFDALPMGSKCKWTSRTDGGSWSETDLKRAQVGLIIEMFDDGAKPWRWRGSYGKRG